MNESDRRALSYAAEMHKELSPRALHDHDLPLKWRVFLDALKLRSKLRKQRHDAAKATGSSADGGFQKTSGRARGP